MRFAKKNLVLAVLSGLVLAEGAAAQGQPIFPASPEQMAQYEAETSKTIVELQPYRQQQSITLSSGEDLTLVSLNPNINATFLLMHGDAKFHIENPYPNHQHITLANLPDAAVLITERTSSTTCRLWSGEPTALQTAQASGLPFAPLCEGKLYLRNAIPGSSSQLENVTDFLRDHVWQGEEVVRTVRDTLYKDAHAQISELVELDAVTNLRTGQTCPTRRRSEIAWFNRGLNDVAAFVNTYVWQNEHIIRLLTYWDVSYSPTDGVEPAEGEASIEQDRDLAAPLVVPPVVPPVAPNAPCPALIEAEFAHSAIAPINFGLTLDDRALDDPALDDSSPEQMAPGIWYPVAALEGVFASAIQPRTIDAQILNGAGSANQLDHVEGKAIAYMVAFDLNRYGVGFALGTDHPRLDWSSRPSPLARRDGLPGPDGIRDTGPLVRSGMVGPEHAGRTVATFTAGFKRQHSAFKFGNYSVIDGGKHYGFIEKGTIYSKLKVGLSTLYVLDDGTTEMKTWTKADDALLPRIMYARQNGVPLVQQDPVSGAIMPGDWVNQWGSGNWSGSAEGELRSLRAGACMQTHPDHQYLIYGYFSTATPSAMARAFQAYGCSYAMLLDMNALQHTYLSVLRRRDGAAHVEHIIDSMKQYDRQTEDGTVIPRFLGFPDNRDLFFIHRKDGLK